MKAILFLFLFLSVETSCKNNSVNPLQAEPGVAKDAAIFRPITEEEKVFYQQQGEAFYSGLIDNKNFNGSFLLAKNGQIVMEQYNGYADFATRQPIDASTTFHLASVSKTFTAMAILRMWEQQMLSLDDDVRRFVPNFPYYGITVRMLLNHRSGLPNYAYVMKTKNKQLVYSNDDIVQFFVRQRPKEGFKPNTAFQYCNTNYVLLATIIEKVSGESYPAYMENHVFSPLGMHNTYVCYKENVATVPPSYTAGNRKYNVENFDAIYGDKNIYSNVRDLLIWDKVLYGGGFVRPETAAMAYMGYSHEKPGAHNYGLGWRLIEKDDVKVVYHTGWWHGNCNMFKRVVQDTTTVIILTNRYNSAVFKTKGTAPAFARAVLKSPADWSDVAVGNTEEEGLMEEGM